MRISKLINSFRFKEESLIAKTDVLISFISPLFKKMVLSTPHPQPPPTVDFHHRF